MGLIALFFLRFHEELFIVVFFFFPILRQAYLLKSPYLLDSMTDGCDGGSC